MEVRTESGGFSVSWTQLRSNFHLNVELAFLWVLMLPLPFTHSGLRGGKLKFEAAIATVNQWAELGKGLIVKELQRFL